MIRASRRKRQFRAVDEGPALAAPSAPEDAAAAAVGWDVGSAASIEDSPTKVTSRRAGRSRAATYNIRVAPALAMTSTDGSPR
jgi:hypothetical protein